MSSMLKGVKKNMQESEDARTPTGLLERKGNGGKISPALEREIDVYSTAAMKMMHDKATQPAVINMLRSAPVDQSIPATAMQINAQLEKSMKPKKDVVLAGSVMLVSDLFELVAAAGIAPQATEDEIKGIYPDTLQKYIHEGLKNKTIDPIELQKSVEGLMSDEQKQLGSEIAGEQGLPSSPTAGMAANKLVDDTKMRERESYQQKQGVMSNLAGNAIPNNKGMGGI